MPKREQKKKQPLNYIYENYVKLPTLSAPIIALSEDVFYKQSHQLVGIRSRAFTFDMNGVLVMKGIIDW